MEGEPQNFRKEGVEGKKKKKVLDESKKNQAHAFDQKNKISIISGQTFVAQKKKKNGLNKINCPKNSIIIL